MSSISKLFTCSNSDSIDDSHGEVSQNVNAASNAFQKPITSPSPPLENSDESDDTDTDDDVDYFKANETENVVIPSYKTLNLRVAKNRPKQSVKVCKDDLKGFVKKVAYYVQQNVGKFDILYPVKCKSKPTQWLSLATKNRYLDEALEIFYQQVKNNAVIKWTSDTLAPQARAIKSCEKLHREYLRNPEVNRKNYEMLSTPHTISYLEVFLARLKLIRLVVGDKDSINLLGPSHLKCPIKSCGIVVVLRGFNNMTDITRHWSKHKRTGSELEHNIASKLLDRYQFLIDNDGLWLKEREEVGITDLIDELDNETDSAVRLDLFIPTRESGSFRGSEHWMDDEVVIKVINQEEGALDQVKNLRTIDNFFKPVQKRAHTEEEEEVNMVEIGDDIAVVRDTKKKKVDVHTKPSVPAKDVKKQSEKRQLTKDTISLPVNKLSKTKPLTKDACTLPVKDVNKQLKSTKKLLTKDACSLPVKDVNKQLKSTKKPLTKDACSLPVKDVNKKSKFSTKPLTNDACSLPVKDVNKLSKIELLKLTKKTFTEESFSLPIKDGKKQATNKPLTKDASAKDIRKEKVSKSKMIKYHETSNSSSSSSDNTKDINKEKVSKNKRIKYYEASSSSSSSSGSSSESNSDSDSNGDSSNTSESDMNEAE